jgi:hypothetical protein
MKRMIFSWGVILVILSVALVSYAKWEKIAISKGNLAELKGEWIGSRTIGPGMVKNTDLEILNDTLPVQSKFTLYDMQKLAGGQRPETGIIDFKNGKINDQGNLLITGNNIEVELSLFEDDGKKKLEGNYFWKGTKGTMSFKKK